MTESRRFSRIPFESDSELVMEGQRFRTHLVDISLKGALIERPGDFETEADRPVQLEVNLGASDAVISMKCEIAHLTADRVGLRCVSIDLDSIAHLRRLVELNSGDPKLVERELSALLQIPV